MDPIAKEVWCEALRSGEFRQGRGHLKLNGRYCCLGVAMEIFPGLSREPQQECLNAESSLELLGLRIGQQQDLANLNDNRHSFAEIADYIEREL